jgi:hypothetical protein
MMDETDTLIARTQKRLDWAARVLSASAVELRSIPSDRDVAADLEAEAERMAGLIPGIAELGSRPSRRAMWGQ